MKISQIGSKQFIHDPPSFTNYHVKKKLNDPYSVRSSLQSHRPNHKLENQNHLVKNDTNAIMKTAQDIERIRRETAFIKETGLEPPTWRSEAYKKLHII